MPTTRNIFDGTLGDLQRWVLPSPVWRWKLNQPVDALNRMGATLPRSEQVFGPGAPVKEQAFKFVSIQLDALLVESVSGGNRQVIALPWALRRTPFDEKEFGKFRYLYSSNVQRTSILIADAEDIEEQEITPSYVPGDIVIAIRAVEPFVNVGDESLHLQAVHDRHWAEVLS